MTDNNSYINDNVSVSELTSKLKSTIENINTSIKTNKFGTKVLDELSKQKSVLKSQIDSLISKGESVNGEDELNSSRIIAIATSRQLSSMSEKNDNTMIYAVISILTLAGIYYYYKHHKSE